MSKKLVINGTELIPGQKAVTNLFIARLPTHTTIELPIYSFISKNPGKILLLTAGLHGDEINGIETLRRMIHQNIIKPEFGSVIVIPLVNLYGFLQNSRSLPDGKDLNRSFPGSKTGSLAQRVAHTILEHIIPLIDYGIDFHTGGASRTNYPQIRCAFESESAMNLANAFGAPFLLNSKLIDKSFRKAASRKKKPIIVFEGGESMRFDEFAITEGINGALRVMKYLNIITQEVPEPADTIVLKSSSWIRARYSGLLHSDIKFGEYVNQNQVLGYITDPFGESNYKIKARHTGYIIGLNKYPVINAGDALYHLGTC